MLIKITKLILIAFLGMVLLSCQKSAQAPEVGKSAPNFSLSDLNKNTISLESLKGNVVLINIWSYT